MAPIGQALARALMLDAEIWRQPGRLSAVLKDLCPERTPFNRVLTLAAEEGFVAELARLRADGNVAPGRPEIRRLVNGLSDRTGLSDDWAEWGVRAWGSALGLAPAVAPLGPARPPSTPSPPSPASPLQLHRGSAPIPGHPPGAPSPLPPGPTLRSSRPGIPPWILASALISLLALGTLVVYGLAGGGTGAMPAPRLQPARVDLRPVTYPGDWGTSARQEGLRTPFIGYRQLASGGKQTLILEIREIQPAGSQGIVVYVLNFDGRRVDNVGTLSFEDGRVQLPDLGPGRLGIDPAGRVIMTGEDTSRVEWRLGAVR